MEVSRKLREEAAVCRELAREIKDPASVAMFLDRAAQLEDRAAAIERSERSQAARTHLVDLERRRVKLS